MTRTEIADAIDPRVGAIELMGMGRIVKLVSDATLIAASDLLRQHGTALEIGRAMGKEEAAKVCDEYEVARGEAMDDRGETAAADLAAAIRASTAPLDVEGMAERCIEAGLAAYNGAPDSHSQNVANVVRAVLTEMVKP